MSPVQEYLERGRKILNNKLIKPLLRGCRIPKKQLFEVLRRRFRSRKNKPVERRIGTEEWFYISIVGLQAVVVILFGFLFLEDLVLPWGVHFGVIQMCKVMAVIANTSIILVFSRHLENNLDKLVNGTVALHKTGNIQYFVGGALFASFVSIFVPEPWNSSHFIFVFLLAYLYLRLDKILSNCHKDPKENELYRSFVRTLDWPNVCAFGVLLCVYLSAFRKDEMYHFASGAIAFQWLASNVIFVILVIEHKRNPKSQTPSGAKQKENGSGTPNLDGS